MKKSKVILMVLILIIGLGALTIFGVMRLNRNLPEIGQSGEENDVQSVEKNETDEDNITNVNSEVVEQISIDGVKKVGAIEFSNIKIGFINNSKCEFTADIKNTSKEFAKARKVSIKVKDENGEIKASFGGVITDLAGLEPNKFKTYVLSNITYAKDVDIEVVNE